MRFEVDPLEIYELSDDGEDLGAIYHSHTRSEPVPSQTDINFARELAGGGVDHRRPQERDGRRALVAHR